MTRSILTASAATLLLSSTALLAQDVQSTGQVGFANVFVDVDGSALQVPVSLAAQACALDPLTLQQVAQTRLDEAGVTAASIPGLVAADIGSATGLDASGGLSDIEATPTDTANAMGSGTMSGDAATLGATEGAEAAGSTTTADASSTAAPSSEPAQVEDSSVMAEANSPAGVEGSASADGSTGMASADVGIAGVSGVESTAADTTATAAQGAVDGSAAGAANQYLDLVVCRIDATRASELGISDASGATVTE